MLSALINRAKSVIRILSLALLLAESGYAVSEGVDPRWGYSKLNGPPTWTNTFVTCSGLQQSPVALAATDAILIPAPPLTWKNYARLYGMTLYNTGNTVKLQSSWKTEVERGESTRSDQQDGSDMNKKEVRYLNSPSNDTLRTNLELQNQLIQAKSEPTVAFAHRLRKVTNKANETSVTARSGGTGTTNENLLSYTTHTLEQGIASYASYSTKKRKEKIKQKFGKERGKSKKGSNKSRITDNSNVNNISRIDNSNKKSNLRNEHGFAISLRKHYKNRIDKYKISSTPESKENGIQSVFQKNSSTRAAEEENQNSSTEKMKKVTASNNSQDMMLQYLINRYFSPGNVGEKTNRGPLLSPTSELVPLESVYSSESSNTNQATFVLPLGVSYTNIPNKNTTYELIASKSMNENGGPIYTQDSAETPIKSLQFLTGLLDHSPTAGIQKYFDSHILDSLNALSPATNSLSATTLAYETTTENNILMKQFPWIVSNSGIENGFLLNSTDPLTEPVLHMFDDDINTSPKPILLEKNFPTTSLLKDAFSVWDGWDTRTDSERVPPADRQKSGTVRPNAFADLGGENAMSAQETVIPLQDNGTEERQRNDLSYWNAPPSRNKIQESDPVIFPTLIIPENDVSVDEPTCETEGSSKPTDIGECTQNTENSEDLQFPQIPWLNQVNITGNNNSNFEVFSQIPMIVDILPDLITNRFHSTTPSTTKLLFGSSMGPSILPSTLIDFLNINAMINSPHSSKKPSLRKPCAQRFLQTTINHLLNINAFFNSPPVPTTTEPSGNSISTEGNILRETVTEFLNTNAFSNPAPKPAPTHTVNTGSEQFRLDLLRPGNARKSLFRMANASILNNNYEFINTYPIYVNSSNSSNNFDNGPSSYFYDLSNSTLPKLSDTITGQESFSIPNELKDDSSSTIFPRDRANNPNTAILTSPTFGTMQPVNTSLAAYNLGPGSFPFNVASVSQIEKSTEPCSMVSDEMRSETITGSQALYNGRNTNVPQAPTQQHYNDTGIGVNVPYNTPRSFVGSENVTQIPKVRKHPINVAGTVNILPRNEIQKLTEFSNSQLRGKLDDCQNTEKLPKATEFLKENMKASTNVDANLSIISPASISQPMGNVTKHVSGSIFSPAKRNASFNLSTTDDSVLSKIRETCSFPKKATGRTFPITANNTLRTVGNKNLVAPQLQAKSHNNNSKVKNLLIDIEKKENDKLGIILHLNKLAKGDKERHKKYLGNRNIADSYSLKPTKPAVFKYAANATESLPTKYGMHSNRRGSKHISRVTPNPKMFASKTARLFPSLRKKETSVRMKRFEDTWQSVPQLLLGDDVFVLDSIHFHWGGNDTVGSEHQLNGVRFPLEMNAVHQRRRSVANGAESDAGKDPQLVVAQFFQVCENCHNHGLEILTRELKDVRRAGTSRDVVVPLEELVRPFYRNFYVYHGSLTTPPCTECVTYIVSRNVAMAAPRQIALFRDLLNPEKKPLVNNFRPLQPRNGRKILMAN